ncbi:hypothetical protein KAX22_07405 [bacterium]|nr:hypothetical protein [bacterium]
MVARLLEHIGGGFARELGIQLEGGREEEVFKWFLASLLFGARISERIAVQTFHEFCRRGVVTPRCILDTGWDGLVAILDAAGYVRYDFKTASKLLQVCGNLLEHYGGSLTGLHAASRDSQDLEARIIVLGKGIGPVTVNIFLRELRGIWPKAQPDLSPLARLAAGNLGLIARREHKKALQELSSVGLRELAGAFSLPDLEAALVRLGRDFCRRKRCPGCPLKSWCPSSTGA